jgi:3-isopropylmalate/(R)-2-methylmalate dehydratase large subunit
MTMTQKILAAHAGLKEVKAGQFIEAGLDIVLANDITGPPAAKEFARMGAKSVFDPDKVVLVPDHFTPNRDIKAAAQCAELRAFAREQGIVNYFELGAMGIEHALLPEKGLVVAGDSVIGADSHTCTYGALGAFSTGVGSTDMAAGMATGRAWFKVPAAMRFEITGRLQGWVSGKDVILHIIGMIGVGGALYKSMEFVGPGLKSLSMDDRFTIANMAVEAGAKNGIFEVDDVTRAYMSAHVNRSGRPEKRARAYSPDDDASYERTIGIHLPDIRPTVAFPHLPENTRAIDDVGEIPIDQVVIGSCTNGRLGDMEAAASILKGRKVAEGVRCIIFPGTQQIYLECLRKGYAEIFVEAGAVLSTPTCGPCIGGHMGVLAAGERAVSTTNRNFVGRMGHVDSEVYLASPAVAAASAVAGRIANPDEVVV